MSMAFQRGQRVEVMSEEKGFEGSYYPAVVISQVSEKMYIVQCSTLHEGQLHGYNEFRPSREFCKEQEIRPIPPEIAVSEFSPKDKVDAYCNDGWWFGEIVCIKYQRVAPHKNKYLVYFRKTGDKVEMDFHHLRVHQDWSNGQWSTPKKVGRPPSSKRTKLYETKVEYQSKEVGRQLLGLTGKQ